MLIAVDTFDNRIYVEEVIANGDRKKDYFCPACHKPVILKCGDVRTPHFAHKRDENCSHGSDMSEWHIRMQKYFPKESREVRFNDEKTDEIHIADIYDEKSRIVVEFQHSPITPEEFRTRTVFHINNGRRIVWIFDESKELKKKSNCCGKLQVSGKPLSNEAKQIIIENTKFIYDNLQFINKENEFNCNLQWRLILEEISRGYSGRWLKWLYRRKVFGRSSGCPDIVDNADSYCVCIYPNSEKDMVFKVLLEDNGFEHVLLSINPFILNETIELEDFFKPEKHWINNLPNVKKIETQRQLLESNNGQLREHMKGTKTRRQMWKPMKRNNHL